MVMKKSLLLLSALLLTACGPDIPSQLFAMDNPTDDDIVVLIDNQSYEIASSSSINVTLPAGRHALTYEGETIHFIVNPKDQPAVINPTLTPYVLYSQIYQDDSGRGNWEELAENQALTKYEIEGEEVYLPWKYTKGELFFNRYDYNWHFDVDTELPETYYTESGQYDYIDTMARVKLMRLTEFYQMLLEEGIEDLPEELVPVATYQKLSEIPKDLLTPAIGTPFCENVVIDLKIKQDEYQAMIQNSDPLLHHDLMNPFTMPYYSVYDDLFSKETYAFCKEFEAKNHFGSEDGLWVVRKRVYELTEKLGASSAFVVE